MAKAYLIGGTPRTGKTVLAMRAIKEHPMLAASADAIRYTLRRILDEDQHPNLFHFGKYTSNDPAQREYLRKHVQEAIYVQNKESAIVWKSVKDFIMSNIDDGQDVLMEGTALLPSFVTELECEYEAVFLGNQSDNHYKKVHNFAKENSSDWMHELEVETIKAFAEFGNAYSGFIKYEAAAHQMSYFEISDEDFDGDIDRALSALMQK